MLGFSKSSLLEILVKEDKTTSRSLQLEKEQWAGRERGGVHGSGFM